MIATIVSWVMSLGGMGLLASPVIVMNVVAKRRFPARRGVLTGAMLGLLIVPFSVWLYAQYFVDPIRALIFGLPGVLSLALHVGPFGGLDEISNVFLETDSGDVPGLGKVYLRCICLWIPVYALLGAFYDKFLAPLQTWRQTAEPRK